MATRATTEQFIRWSAAPTFTARAGTAQTFDLKHFLKDTFGYTLHFFVTNDSPNSYPAGWTQSANTSNNATNGIITWDGRGNTVAQTNMRWRVVAVQTGNQTRSPIGWIRTLAAIVLLPKVPTGVTAIESSTSTVDVSWTPGVGGSTITQYRVKRADAQTGPYSLIHTVTAPTTTKQDTGLEAGRKYWYTVSAWDGVAESSDAIPDDATTFPGVPDAPVSVAATGTTNTTIRVTWIPAMTLPAAETFNVQRATEPDGTFGNIATGVTDHFYDDDSLTQLETRSYRIRAVDGSGALSAPSAVVTAQTKADPVPGRPTATATAVSDTQINVGWTAGPGPAATHYRLYRKRVITDPMVLFVDNLTVSPYEHTSIVPEKQVWYSVSAVGSGGESEQSIIVSATTHPEFPATPAAVTAVGLSTSTIRLTWQDGNNGVPVAKYKVLIATSLNGTYTPHVTEPTEPTFDHTGLVTGDIRFYKIVAVDEQNDESVASAPVEGRTKVELTPTMPTGVTATGISTTAIQIGWTPGAGGSTITEYRIYREASSGGAFTNVHATADAVAPHTHNDTGLTEGDVWYYRVAAWDGTSLSAKTPVKEGRTLLTPAPAIPVAVSARALSNSAIEVSWLPGQGGSEVDYFKIYRSSSSGGTYGPDPIGQKDASPYNNTGLAAGAEWFYKVSAVDINGNESAKSAFASARTNSSAATVLFLASYDTANVQVYPHHTWATNMKAKYDGAPPYVICEVASANPICNATRYQQTTLIKNSTANYRSEFEPDHNCTGLLMTAQGGGHFKLNQTLWYGLRIRIVRCDDNIGGYYIQWHDNPGGGGKSPPVALLGSGDSLRMRLEKNDDDPDGDLSTPVLSPILISSNIVGVSHDWMFHIQWDTRKTSNGGTGFIKVYLDDNTSPVWEWTGQTCHPYPETINGEVPYPKIGLYKSAYHFASGAQGATNIQRHDNLKIVSGNNGGLADVKPPGTR